MWATVETNSCTQLQKALEPGEGGQKCSCRAATSVAVMMAWNITHAKVLICPEVAGLEPDTQTNPLKPTLHRGPFNCWKSDSTPAQPEWFRLHRLLLQVIKKVAEPLSALQMVSPFPRLNYTDIGCCENSHTIHPLLKATIIQLLRFGNMGVLEKGRWLVGDIREAIIQAIVSWQTIKIIRCPEPLRGLMSRESSRLFNVLKEIWKLSYPENTWKAEMSDTQR